MKFFSYTTEIDSYQIQKLEGFNLKEVCFLQPTMHEWVLQVIT